MARKSVSFGLVIHRLDGVDRRRTRAVFQAFYTAQVFKTLQNSSLGRQEQIQALDRLERMAGSEPGSSP